MGSLKAHNATLASSLKNEESKTTEFITQHQQKEASFTRQYFKCNVCEHDILRDSLTQHLVQCMRTYRERFVLPDGSPFIFGPEQATASSSSSSTSPKSCTAP